MAPTPASLALEQRIEQELLQVKARATELRITLKVLREFDADDMETATNGAETSRIILTPGDDVPEAVKSRLSEHGSAVADKAFEIDQS